MIKEQFPPLTCTDCDTQNCKYKNRTSPDFCLTTNLKEEDLEWALERYNDDDKHHVMVASTEVEHEGYYQLTHMEKIMAFARKMSYRKIGITHCIGLLNEVKTNLNVTVGLCVAHDGLFYKYSDAYSPPS